MKKRLIYAILSSFALGTSAYAIESTPINSIQNDTQGQPQLISFYNEKPFDQSLDFDIDTKGDTWVDPTDIINIFSDRPEDTYNNLNDLNNNTYFLKDKKADTTYVDDKLLTKADRTYVDSELSLKPNTINVNAQLDAKADSSAVTSIDTKATNASIAAGNAATDVNNLTLTINGPTNGLASKVTNDDVSSIITTQITSGGSIFEAIGSAAAEGGTIAESIKNQVESESGPVADAIKKGSDDAITTAVATGGAIATTIDTKLADATNTGVIKTALDTKASSTDLDTLANIANTI